MFSICYLCRTEYRESLTGYYCLKCKKIQDLLNIYGPRVHDVLENVLVRAEDKQVNKIKQEINKEIGQKKEYLLRSKTEIK